jgi:hypothetical protein
LRKSRREGIRLVPSMVGLLAGNLSLEPRQRL